MQTRAGEDDTKQIVPQRRPSQHPPISAEILAARRQILNFTRSRQEQRANAEEEYDTGRMGSEELGDWGLERQYVSALVIQRVHVGAAAKPRQQPLTTAGDWLSPP